MISAFKNKNKPYFYLAALCFGIFIAADDQTVIVTILPEVLIDMNIGINELDKASWVITGYLIGYTAVLPFMGSVSDRIGWKNCYIISLLIFGVGSVFVGISPYFVTLFPPGTDYAYWVMISARVFQAVGGGAIIPITIASISTISPSISKPIAYGIVGASAEAGAVIGPLWGGAVTHFTSWSWVFWINVPLVILTGWLAIMCPSGNTQSRKIDSISAVCFGLLVASMTIGFTRIGTPDITMFACLFISVLFLLAIIIRHFIGLGNLFPKTLLSIKKFLWSNLTHFFVGAALIITMLTVPLSCATIYGMNALDSGLELLKFTVTLGVFALIGGISTRHYGSLLPSMIGLIVAALGLWAMSGWDANTLILYRSIHLMGAGAGFGLLIAPITHSALVNVQDDIKGLASSILTTSRILGMLVCLAILTSIGTFQFHELVTGIPSFASDPETNKLIVDKTTGAVIEIFSLFFTWGAIACLAAVVPAIFMCKNKVR